MNPPMRQASWLVGIVLVVLYPSCGHHQIEVVYEPRGDQQVSWSDQRFIQTAADATVSQVRPVLPSLPASLLLRVEPRTLTGSQTGESVAPRPPDTIYWTVDLARKEGAAGIARSHLRASLAHALYYLARRAAGHSDESLREEMISIGLATAFARDLSGSAAPWGVYPPEADQWAQELLALPDDAPLDPWMDRHPDGRLWVAQKVGTYLVDRAVRSSGRSIAQLVSASADEIIQMASPR